MDVGVLCGCDVWVCVTAAVGCVCEVGRFGLPGGLHVGCVCLGLRLDMCREEMGGCGCVCVR